MYNKFICFISGGAGGSLSLESLKISREGNIVSEAASFLPLPKVRTANVKGRIISIIAQTRSRPHLQVRLWGRDSSGEVFVLEETRKGLIDVTATEIGLPQYSRIVPMVQQLRFNAKTA